MTTGERRVISSGRQPAEHAYLLLELGSGAGIQAVVSAVVRSRGDLVDQQFALAREKELDRENADIAQLLGHLQRDACRLAGDLGRDACRDNGGVQNAVAMDVLGHRVARGLALARARQHDRNLRLQIHAPFQDARHAAQLLEAGARRLRGLHRRLSLAVVSEGGGFQQGRGADLLQRALQLVGAVDRLEARGGDAVVAQKALLADPITGRARPPPAVGRPGSASGDSAGSPPGRSRTPW